MDADYRSTYIQSVGDLIALDTVVVVASGNINRERPSLAIDSYPALLADRFPLVVVGAVDTYGIYAHYSKGLAAELTVSAAGRVFCAAREGGATERQGTSYASPAVAGLAAYLMSLDQYRLRLQVPGSVAMNVRDLIKSLAYARLPLQPGVVWNGIDSRQIQCPVRRDASSGCPARNTTLPIVSPTNRKIPSQSPKVTPTPKSTGGASLTMTVLSSVPPSFNIVMGSSGTSPVLSAGSDVPLTTTSFVETLTTALGETLTMASNAPVSATTALAGTATYSGINYPSSLLSVFE